MDKRWNVALIVPLYNGRREFERLVDSAARQTAKVDILAVDSSSSDGTLEFARERCMAVEVIDVKDFNHGGTRQMMVEKFRGYDLYVFMTQDAFLDNEHAIANIIAPFEDKRVGAVCGRQLAHKGASVLAQHARKFNYPESSRIADMRDARRLGIWAAFVSNSFAAYRGEALGDVGGFPRHVILSEDMHAAARMLISGWRVAYAGNACCRHSHDYTVIAEFKRYFDVGVFHSREPWIRETFGGAGGAGVEYVRSELKFLGFKRFHLWPSSLFRNFFKLLGYKLGQQENKLPLWFKKKISMHKRFWDAPSEIISEMQHT